MRHAPDQQPVPSPTPAQLESAFQTPTPVPPLPTPEPTPKRNSYIVKTGDSLWTIAGDTTVQGDSFRWPLLFKANRDQIIDPDLIEPAQDLTWKDNYTPMNRTTPRARRGHAALRPAQHAPQAASFEVLASPP